MILDQDEEPVEHVTLTADFATQSLRLRVRNPLLPATARGSTRSEAYVGARVSMQQCECFAARGNKSVKQSLRERTRERASSELPAARHATRLLIGFFKQSKLY
jgi:hypothetical protein